MGEILRNLSWRATRVWRRNMDVFLVTLPIEGLPAILEPILYLLGFGLGLGTLIGEELYAAGAYLSREPILLGSMRGQDIAKALLMIVGLSGVIAVSLGMSWFVNLVRTQ